MAPTLLVFILATLEIFGRKNKLLDGRGLFGGKVFKIRLEVFIFSPTVFHNNYNK